MRKKVLWITQTAAMLAMLVAIQWVTRPLGQLFTGSCVNTVLAVSVLLCGLWSGVTVSLVSPVMAFLLNIAPQAVTVPAIMAGNLVFVLLLYGICGRENASIARRIAAWLIAAAGKFAVLYVLVNWLICGVASEKLLTRGILAAPMLKKLPGMFSWPQLITALVGGGIAISLVPLLRKALRRI